MENLEKEKIVTDLRKFVAKFPSQNKAANSLKNVSSATISQMLNGKHELISDEMWRSVKAQISDATSGSDTWSIVAITNFIMFTKVLKDAKENSNVFGVVADTGTSKSETIKRFCEENPNAFRLKCGDFWNKKYFLDQLIKSMGRDFSGFTVAEMIDEAVRILKSMDKPVIILDEADKISDQVLYFFITIYNELEGHCGIVLTATDYLEKRILKGVKNNRKGYREIYSRLGKKFIKLPGISSTDVHQICMANAITEKEDINKVWIDCDGDLRRVKRKIHAMKNIKNGD